MTLGQLGNSSFLLWGSFLLSALVARTTVPCAMGTSGLTGKVAVQFMTTYHKILSSVY